MIGQPKNFWPVIIQHVVMAAFLAVTVAGCGNGQAAQQLETARQAVQTALDAWKRAESAATLAAASVPIEFYDDEWVKAATLVQYEILNTYMDPDGTPRCSVQLVVKRGNDTSETVKATYQIVAKDKKIIIGRDPFS